MGFPPSLPPTPFPCSVHSHIKLKDYRVHTVYHARNLLPASRKKNPFWKADAYFVPSKGRRIRLIFPTFFCRFTRNFFIPDTALSRNIFCLCVIDPDNVAGAQLCWGETGPCPPEVHVTPSSSRDTVRGSGVKPGTAAGQMHGVAANEPSPVTLHCLHVYCIRDPSERCTLDASLAREGGKTVSTLVPLYNTFYFRSWGSGNAGLGEELPDSICFPILNTLHLTIPRNTVPNLTIPRNTVPNHTNLTIPRNTVPNHTKKPTCYSHTVIWRVQKSPFLPLVEDFASCGHGNTFA